MHMVTIRPVNIGNGAKQVGRKTKVDWCDSTWNPVTGCLHGCEYCYAWKISERFGGFQSRENGKFTSPYGDEMLVLDEPVRKELIENVGYYDVEPGVVYCGVAPYPNFFHPTFHRYKLKEPQHWKKPRTIFVCSMADLFGDWVPEEWIQEVFKACAAAPQHRYLFLTKNPKRYGQLLNGYMPSNMWFGWSQEGPMGSKIVFSTHQSVQTFVSVEPLLHPFDQFSIRGIGWAIVGAETGKRKDKVIPQKEWVEKIADACQIAGVPIFMKESLRELMGADFRQEYPWEARL